MDSRKYFSSIRPELKKEILFRGSLWAALGTIPLIYGGAFFGVQELGIWGIALLGFWLFCLLVGMIPYRKLTRKESNPDSLVIDSEKITYFKGKNEILRVPLQSIESLSFVDDGLLYGIGVRLKNPVPEKVVVFDEKSTIYGVEGYSLFFEYFSERVCKDLKEELMDEKVGQ